MSIHWTCPGRAETTTDLHLLALAALLVAVPGDGGRSGRGAAALLEEVDEAGLLAVDAGGVVLLGDHAVHEAARAGADQHRRPASRAAVRRNARAWRRRAAVVVAVAMAAVHLHPHRRRQVQLQLQPPVAAAVTVAPVHGSNNRTEAWEEGIRAGEKER